MLPSCNQKLLSGGVCAFKFVLSQSSVIRRSNFQDTMKGPKAFKEERGKKETLFLLVKVVLYQEDPSVSLEL